jgi:hypothetical protein
MFTVAAPQPIVTASRLSGPRRVGGAEPGSPAGSSWHYDDCVAQMSDVCRGVRGVVHRGGNLNDHRLPYSNRAADSVRHRLARTDTKNPPSIFSKKADSRCQVFTKAFGEDKPPGVQLNARTSRSKFTHRRPQKKGEGSALDQR